MKQNSFRDMKKLSFLIIAVLALSCFAPLLIQNVKAVTYSYTFYGPYSEALGVYDNSIQVQIRAQFTNTNSTYVSTIGYNGSVVINTYTYTPTSQPLFFSYVFFTVPGYANYTREYWLSPNENTGTYYIQSVTGGAENNVISPITFNIRALGGVSVSGMLSAIPISHAGNIQYTVDKRLIDDTDICTLYLQPNSVYTIIIGNAEGSTYTFENVNTYTNPITLTVSALSFPSNILYQYPYVTIYASRPDPTDILVSYRDLKSQTISVSYTITDQNGNLVDSASYGAVYSFADDWSGAQANVTYYFSATLTGSVFGVSTYSQILAASNAPNNPIDLSIFGNWGNIGIANPDQLIWIFIALAVFLCFSALNAYVGAFAGICVATFFAWEGWLQIPETLFVAAFCIVFMAIIAAWKRPPQYG